MVKAAALLRVSTKKQDEETQVAAIERLRVARGAELVHTVRLRAGSDSAEMRRARLELLDGIRRGAWREIFVAKLDRWSREPLVSVLSEMDTAIKYGGIIVSEAEPFTADPLFGQLFAALSAWFANYERGRIRERTTDALTERRARIERNGFYIREKDGKRIDHHGRPAHEVSAQAIARVRDLRSAGVGWRPAADMARSEGLIGPEVGWATMRKRVIAAAAGSG